VKRGKGGHGKQEEEALQGSTASRARLSGEKGEKRMHVRSPFMMESLLNKELIHSTHSDHEISIFPEVNVVKIGGLSLIDRGKAAVFPLVDEIIESSRIHKLIVGVGGGTRERHTYAIGLDLGLPTGGLAMIAGAIPEQNALLMQVLLAKAGGIRIAKEDFEKLPIYLRSGSIPIVVGMPPYHYWEHPAQVGRIPQHGSDTGMYLLAEVFSTRSCIFVKDVDGVFTDDPKTNPKAEFIPEISAKALLAMNLRDLPVERMVLEILQRGRNCRAIRLINGLIKGNLTKALNGEAVGTLIHQ
jgi:molybdenum storage protein